MIKLFAMDVDGTLTDGGLYMDGHGGELKKFDVKDGQGIALLLKSGVKIAFISGRFCAATKQRAENLRITRLINGTADKLGELKKLAKELNITAEEIAYAGDDLPDIECIEFAGLGIAVGDAHSSVLKCASYVTKANGGHGAIRECADCILAANSAEQENKIEYV